MNEEHEIFTSGTFGDCASAAEGTVYSAEDIPPIDPHDPFDNETEFHAYQPDYGHVVPQIRIPGCRIPLFPNRGEKRNIRRFYSIAGGGVLANFLLTNILAVLLMQLVSLLISAADSRLVPELPLNYPDLLSDYMMNSSTAIAINMIAYLIGNAGVALIGLRISKLSVASLFQTKHLTGSRILSYVLIAISLQMLCGLAATAITELMSGAGITAYEADFSTSKDIKSVILMVLYVCLVAPVTEELFYRGFLLKNLSRVSQRFGIFASAFLFGLAHQNISQFVLAFVVGIFMGYLTVKHNSLVPSIIAHMAVNTTSQILSLLDLYFGETIVGLASIAYLGIVIAGAILLVRMLIKERLPYTVPRQVERCGRIAITSIPLVLSCICHLAMMILLIVETTIGIL